VKTPKSPKAGDYNDEFIEKTVNLRGKDYLFRELDVSTYDDLVLLATSKNEAGEEMIDNALLRKLLTVKSCVSPRLPDGLVKMPMRLAQKLQVVAQEINYGIEPETDDKSDKEPDVQEGEPEEEGEA
jgi:hypothetical protein